MGLYDRDYMRERSKSPLNALFDGNFSAVGVLIVANVVCFIVGAFVASTSWGPSIFSFFELSLNGLLHGRIWTLVTYLFLYYDFLHIFLNMLGLFFIGKYLEHFLGPRKFLAVYFCGAVLGGLIWLATGFGRPEVLIGASAAVTAVFAAFCAVYPPVPLTFMIFFVLPVSVKPMTMLKIAAAMELAGFAVEILGGHPVVAYSAHLGGMAAGLAMGQQMAAQMAGTGAAQMAGGQAPYGQGNAGSGQTQHGVIPNFCPNCGAKTNGMRFCGNCGYKLAE